jgi:hypothetical protein
MPTEKFGGFMQFSLMPFYSMQIKYDILICGCISQDARVFSKEAFGGI